MQHEQRIAGRNHIFRLHVDPGTHRIRGPVKWSVIVSEGYDGADEYREEVVVIGESTPTVVEGSIWSDGVASIYPFIFWTTLPPGKISPEAWEGQYDTLPSDEMSENELWLRDEQSDDILNWHHGYVGNAPFDIADMSDRSEETDDNPDASPEEVADEAADH
jgi:hypothetical protein